MKVTDDVAEVAGWVRAAAAVTVLTGPGMSPDPRAAAGGLAGWARGQSAQRMFSLEDYRARPQVRRQEWANRREHPGWSASPNPGHHALVALERSGRLLALVTETVDRLHHRAGTDPDLVIELAGAMVSVDCLDCGAVTPMQAALDRLADGDPDPRCTECGGIQKCAAYSFGQGPSGEMLAAATRAAVGCEVFLAVGSTLRVQPAPALCEVAAGVGAKLVIVNPDPTGYDGEADAVLRAAPGAVLPALVAG